MGRCFAVPPITATFPTTERRGPRLLTAFREWSIPWFGDSDADHRLFFWDLEPIPTVVSDDVDKLASIVTRHTQAMVVYQHYVTPGGEFQPFDQDMARKLCGVVKGSSVQQLFVLTTTFQTGAVAELARELRLETFGVLYCYTGDNLTDQPEHAEEIGTAARIMGCRRLSVLTRAFNEKCEDGLVTGLTGSGLEVCRVFERDQAKLYPLFPTPKLGRLLAG